MADLDPLAAIDQDDPNPLEITDRDHPVCFVKFK